MVDQSAIVLRPYQETILDAVRSCLRRNIRRILIQSPTGSGKTILAAFMLYEAWLRGKTVWFINHRRELVLQSATKFWEAKIPAGIVAAGFYPDHEAGVQVASIQTLVRRHEKLRTPNLIVWDECHHLGAKTWSSIHKAYPDAIHIGLSATPIRNDGMGLGAYFDELILGPSVQRLMDDGWLSPYRLFGPPGKPDLTNVKTIAGDYDQRQLDEVMKSSTVTGDAVQEYLRLGNGQTGVVFTWSVAASIEIAQKFNSVGVPAAHIDGTTPDHLRTATVKAFRDGEIKILSNCSIISEGFDLPICVNGYFLKPTKSLNVYLQEVGRVLRPFPGKIAQLHDHAGNYERFGLPHWDRSEDWTLDGRDKKPRKKKDPSDATKVCPGCFQISARTAQKCSNCGHEFLIVPRSVDQEDGELTEIDIKRMQREKRMEQGSAQSMQDLIAIAKARHYKSPWAWAKRILESREKKEQERAARRNSSSNNNDSNGWLSF